MKWATRAIVTAGAALAVLAARAGAAAGGGTAAPEFDAADATAALQAAIDSGAAKVVLRKMAGPWICGPLRLASNQEIVFEPGVEVLAKKDAFHGGNDSLFTGSACANVRLTGPEATLRMRRADYDGPAYTHAEWRHVLNLRSVTNVTIEGLTLAESGGDGIYLGVDRGGGPCVGVTVRKVTCDRNYRQGISVISASHLLIEDTVFRATAGTAPEAGIDFEPNRPGERLEDCVLRRCVAENNRGSAYTFYTAAFAATSTPVGVRLEDCVSRGTNRISLAVHLGSRTGGPGPGGAIEFVNCRFEDEGRAGIRIGKPADGARVVFESCSLADPSGSASTNAPIRLEARAGQRCAAGGVVFLEFALRERVERPSLAFQNGGGVPLRDVSGSLIVTRSGLTKRVELDADWLEQTAPADPFFDLAPATLAPALSGLLPPPHVGAQERRGSTYRLRGTSVLLVHAGAGDAVWLDLRHQTVGRRPAESGAGVTVQSPSGAVVARAKVGPGATNRVAFTAREAGWHRIVCEADAHTVGAVAASHPLRIGGEEGVVHLLNTVGRFGIAVPAGTAALGVRVGGPGEGEAVRAAVVDPAGRTVWEQDDLASPRGTVVRDPAPGMWTLRMARPAHGVLEDVYVELRGVAPVMSVE